MRRPRQRDQFGFSRGQQSRYRALLEAAYQADCKRTGQNPEIDGYFETWKRDQMMIATGFPSSKFCNQVEDYDSACLHLATIAGDEKEIEHFSNAAERRYQHLINKALESISLLEQRPCTWSYAVAVFDHMQLPLTMAECPAMLLRKVFLALDTHVRRLRKNKMNSMRGAT